MLSDNLADKFNLLKTKAFSSLDRAGERAFSVDDYVVDRFNHSFGSSIAIWLTNHPLIAWAVGHPFITLIASLIIAVLTIRLMATIYRAIANIIDRMWLGILRSPFILLKLIFGWEAKTKADSLNTVVTNYEVTNDSEKLALIMARLNTIEQQQEQIIKDLAALKQQPLTVEPQRLRLVNEKTISSIESENS